MRWVSMPRPRALVYGVIVAVLGGLILGTGFVLSGLYNVAASVQHFDITNAVIRMTLRRSVATRSIGIEPPDNLSDEALARLGARHFALGCAPCHASPGAAQNPVAAEMYPAPPPLSHAVEDWQTSELFWIVKHGLKFTGMPSWPALERDEEIWALVAFLERLPDMSAEQYAAMTGRETEQNDGSGFDFDLNANDETVTAFCANCHGDTDAAPVHPLAPPLEGQKQDYLHRALVEYAEERRPSGIMEPIAAELDSAAIDELARHYAELSERPAAERDDVDPDSIRRGGLIALSGVRDDDIPACVSCHSTESSGQFPRLAGLSAEYIATQLRLFRNGVRDQSTYAQIMAPIARRLSDQQLEDVAAFFASRSEENGGTSPSEQEP